MLYITEDIHSFDLLRAIDALPPQRRLKAMAFRHETDRRACTAAYMLLSRALYQEYGIDEPVELGLHEGGKPFIVGREDIHFNLSHCRSAVACAVDGNRVGVDIETIRAFNENLARRVLGEREYLDVMAAQRQDIAFIRYWTKKESYLKMTGEGIRCDLRSIPLEEARFDTVESDAGGYVCTVCADLSSGSRPLAVNRISLL